jgi:hypothetical protein
LTPTGKTVRVQRDYYLGWLDANWWRIRGWKDGFRDMVFWYSVAGTAVMSEGPAWRMLDDAKSGKKLPLDRKQTWRQAKALSLEISEKRHTNPVDWFTGGCGCAYTAWRTFDGLKYVGPKIASWIMRDLGLMRDYSDGSGGRELVIRRKSNPAWYDRLPEECQALFVPIDTWVHDGARRCGIGGVVKKYGTNTIQLDADLHVEAATQIVRWARKHTFDPRDLDIYWYLTGSGKAD